MITAKDYVEEILRAGFTAKFNTTSGEIVLGDTTICDNGTDINISLAKDNAKLDIKVVFTEKSAMASLTAFTGDDNIKFVPENGIVFNVYGLKKPEGFYPSGSVSFYAKRQAHHFGLSEKTAALTALSGAFQTFRA